MFNGYHESPMVSYTELNQERIEKNEENGPKWSYGCDDGPQPPQTHLKNRHSEIWSDKSKFLGYSNVVKCNCSGCYASIENRSYQGDTTRHRRWLPQTFPITLSSSNDSCKLSAFEWNNGLSNQSSCSLESGLPYRHEDGQAYSHYRHSQNTRFPELNQPGFIITSVKDPEFAKKPKDDVFLREKDSQVQGELKHSIFCNSAYNLTRRLDDKNYCDPSEKYTASCSVNQQKSKFPVVEPFIKTVPSNLNQNRVPLSGYQSVKENIHQGYGEVRKINTEPAINGDKRTEVFSTEQLQNGAHMNYSYFYRDFPEMEPQKLFFENSRNPDGYFKSNFQEMTKRTNHFDYKKDFEMNQFGQIDMLEQHCNTDRSKCLEAANVKSSYEAYPKDLENTASDDHLHKTSSCFRLQDEDANVHARLPRSTLIFNDPRFSDRTQNSFSYQNHPNACMRNYFHSDFSCPSLNNQIRFEYSGGLQKNDLHQFKAASQQMENSEQFFAESGSSFVCDPYYQHNQDKVQEFYEGNTLLSNQSDSQLFENKKPNCLKTIPNEEISKNGTNKISPLRLLRKKKFINVPQEPATLSIADAPQGLDVRKFWSTWAEVEGEGEEKEAEKNEMLTQMIVLDCQSVDLEQAKLIHLYETDPGRTFHQESANSEIKDSASAEEFTYSVSSCEEIKELELKPTTDSERETQKPKDDDKFFIEQQAKMKKKEDRSLSSLPEAENHIGYREPVRPRTSPAEMSFNKRQFGHENHAGKQLEVIDKWTEKKFDFLKRAEESKAAEVLRHEENKKVIATRLSFQQSLKETEKHLDKNPTQVFEKVCDASSVDENSLSDSVEETGADVSCLPTSEFRRNKFLDYSETIITSNRKGKTETATESETVSINSFAAVESPELTEKQYENGLKPEGLIEKNSAEPFFPINEFKKETIFEKRDIANNTSELNFENSKIEVGIEAEDNRVTNLKSQSKKSKKKKLDHHGETEERTDELTLETVAKPSIKFSIQKSHDLKISFKVMNSGKEHSDECERAEDSKENENFIEDSKSSTELITLKYKSILKTGEKNEKSDFKRSLRQLREKKRNSVLKSKKSSPVSQGDEESSALEKDCESVRVSKKFFLNNYPASDDFLVQETIDSAKIKLTFKRHKKSFQKKCKISRNVEKDSEVEPMVGEENKGQLQLTRNKNRKKTKRGKKLGIFRERATEGFRNQSELQPNTDSHPEREKSHLKFIRNEDCQNSSAFDNSFIKEENFDLPLGLLKSSEILPGIHFIDAKSESGPLKSTILAFDAEKEKFDSCRSTKKTKETSRCDHEEEKIIENGGINCTLDKCDDSLLNQNPSLTVYSKELVPIEVKPSKNDLENPVDLENESIQEISLDFISGRNVPKIGANCEKRKTETVVYPKPETDLVTSEERSSDLEYSKVIEHSKHLISFGQLKFGKSEENEKGYAPGDPDLSNTNQNSIDSNEPIDIGRFNFSRSKSSEETSDIFNFENDDPSGPKELEVLVGDDKTNAVASSSVVIPEPSATETGKSDGELECINSFRTKPIENSIWNAQMSGESQSLDENDISLCKKNSSTSEITPRSTSPFSTIENLYATKNEISKEQVRCEVNPDLPQPESEQEFDYVFKKSTKNCSKNDFQWKNSTCESISEKIKICEKTLSQDGEFGNCKFMNSKPGISAKAHIECSLKNGVTESSPVDEAGSETSEMSFKEAEPLIVNIESFVKDAQSDFYFKNEQNRMKDPENDFSLLKQSKKFKSASNRDVEIKPYKLGLSAEVASPLKFEAACIKKYKLRNSGAEQVGFESLGDDLRCVECKTLSSNSSMTKGNKGLSLFVKNQSSPPSRDNKVLNPQFVSEAKKVFGGFSLQRKKNSLCRDQSSNAVNLLKKSENSTETRKRKYQFFVRKVKRRHSMSVEKLNKINNPLISKAKSCSPEPTFSDLNVKKKIPLNFLIEDIPLPFGPPPHYSCVYWKKYYEKSYIGVKNMPNELIVFGKPRDIQAEPIQSVSSFHSSLEIVKLQDCSNVSPPACPREAPFRSNIATRKSKIQCLLSNRSKFSKTNLKNPKNRKSETSSSKFTLESQAYRKINVENFDIKKEETNLTLRPLSVQCSVSSEGKVNDNSKSSVVSATEGKTNLNTLEENSKPPLDLEEALELLSKDVGESIEGVNSTNNFVQDEFYECEDIPTSEDLTNSGDLEVEKVNDDKFKNIMQNCLENAKKFLNFENLKLFSCSVDDLLELSCRSSESAVEVNEIENSINPISRDVLLTPCEDTNGDLGLSDAALPTNVLVDVVPSLCSDVCTEILSVDNWPYLEEEVTSSPNKSKQDESVLMPSLKNGASNSPSACHLRFDSRNQTERPMPKRILSEIGFPQKYLVSSEETLKIEPERRNTLDSFTFAYGKRICDITNEIMRLKTETDVSEKKSLKRCLNLEKLRNEQEINFGFKNERVNRFVKNSVHRKGGLAVEKTNDCSLDYRSPSWQPKVMLFRISKSELRNALKNSKTQSCLRSEFPAGSSEKEIFCESEGEVTPAFKKQKLKSEIQILYIESNHNAKRKNEPLEDRNQKELKSIEMSSTAEIKKKKKKSRFRNLHGKEEHEMYKSKKAKPSDQNSRLSQSKLVAPKTPSTETFDDKAQIINVSHGHVENLGEIKLNDKHFLSSSSKTSREWRKKTHPKQHPEKFDTKREYQNDEREKTKSFHKNKVSAEMNRWKHKRHRFSHSRSENWRKSASRESQREKAELERPRKDRHRLTEKGGGKRRRSREEADRGSSWACEVCGFDDINERMVHIKSHPFHCQSCHLAFRTESHFTWHLSRKHKDIRNQHHCLLCELSFDTEGQYQNHLQTREHQHLESVEKNTINTLFTLLTGAPCPVLGLVEMKPEWLPNQAGTVHFYHQATPLSLALQYLKMRRDLSSFSRASSAHST